MLLEAEQPIGMEAMRGTPNVPRVPLAASMGCNKVLGPEGVPTAFH